MKPAEAVNTLIHPTKIVAVKVEPIVKAVTGMEVPKPMLAHALNEDKVIIGEWAMSADIKPYCNPKWVLETKLDGIRCTVRVKGGAVQAWSRPQAGAAYAHKRALPDHIVERLLALPDDSIYDAELIVPGKKSSDAARLDNWDKLVLVVFDVLRLLGTDIVTDPYTVRRQYLETIFEARGSDEVRIVDSWPVSAEKVMELWAANEEGAMLKRVDSRYRHGRCKDWLKVKKIEHRTVTIIGFKPGTRGPHATLLAVDSDGVKTSVKVLDAELSAIEAHSNLFLGQKLVIEYTERFDNGKFRHPRSDHWLTGPLAS